jgi:adenosylcobinamide-GDP ribazoletransferase
VEALSDFSDGLMVHGNVESRKKVMKDPRLGTVGAVILIMYILGMIMTISSFYDYLNLFFTILVSEVFAKFSMVLQIYKARSAWAGLASPFVNSLNTRKLFISLCVVIPFLFLNNFFSSLISFLFVLSIVAILRVIANVTIGGISGDVIGTTNELTRLSSLILMSPLIVFND